jgi:hypothetical protein
LRHAADVLRAKRSADAAPDPKVKHIA